MVEAMLEQTLPTHTSRTSAKQTIERTADLPWCDGRRTEAMVRCDEMKFQEEMYGRGMSICLFRACWKVQTTHAHTYTRIDIVTGRLAARCRQKKCWVCCRIRSVVVQGNASSYTPYPFRSDSCTMYAKTALLPSPEVVASRRPYGLCLARHSFTSHTFFLPECTRRRPTSSRSSAGRSEA
jgi:hypothetical protein